MDELARASVRRGLFGGIVALRISRSLPVAISLTGGMVIAVALFDVLPESIRTVSDPQRVGTLVGAGFLGFFVAERALILHHRDEPEQARAHAEVGALGAAGLSIHSFIDGLGIGLASGLNRSTGVLVAVAVIAHDFADGMNTVTFVLGQGSSGDGQSRGSSPTRAHRCWGRPSAPRSTSRPRPSAASSPSTPGVFLHMGACDLLPRAHAHPSARRVALTVAGFVVIYLVVRATVSAPSTAKRRAAELRRQIAYHDGHFQLYDGCRT